VTFDEAIRRLDEAGLWQEMLPYIELEPLPAGEFLFRDVEIADAGPVHVGGDSSGGAYVRLSDGRILLLGSEGEAGVIGAGLEAALAHGVGVGGLYDALRFMGGEDVEAARESWHAFRAQWNLPTDPERDPAAREIVEVLDLTLPDDPFASLHAAVRSTPEGIARMDGTAFRRFGAPLTP
jgi:hypothetical protein